MKVWYFLLFLTLSSTSQAGCTYICENGLSCIMTCDGFGFLTVPDPSTNYAPPSNGYSSEDESYTRSEHTPRSEYDNEHVNDLPNTEEPDIFEADFPSLEGGNWNGQICDDNGCN